MRKILYPVQRFSPCVLAVERQRAEQLVFERALTRQSEFFGKKGVYVPDGVNASVHLRFLLCVMCHGMKCCFVLDYIREM